jgi:hypothetical protein
MQRHQFINEGPIILDSPLIRGSFREREREESPLLVSRLAKLPFVEQSLGVLTTDSYVAIWGINTATRFLCVVTSGSCPLNVWSECTCAS